MVNTQTNSTQWLQAQYLYNQLEQSPEVRATYPVLDSFYMAVQDNGFEDMGNTEEWLADIADSAVNADANAFTLWYDKALAANNEIDTNTDQQMASEQIVNDAYLRYSRYGIDSLTQEDYGNIATLALQCPLVGGTAVYKARMLYSIYQPSISYDDLEICNNAGLYKGGKGLFDDENELLAQQSVVFDEGILKVFPNPTSGLLTFEYKIKPTDKVSVVITDVYGKLVLNKVFAIGSNKSTVDIDIMPPAVYFYRYLVNGITTNTGKIVLIK